MGPCGNDVSDESHIKWKYGGHVLGLDVEDVDKDQLGGDPGSVDAVKLPLGVLPCTGPRKRVDVVVDDEGDLNGDVHDHQTLGTELEGHDLDGVGDEETRPGESVGNTVQPDEQDDGDAGALVASPSVLGRADGDGHEEQEHTPGSGQEERATTDAVAQHGTGDGNDERQDLVAAVKTETGARAVDTGAGVDLVGVVRGQGVARPLGEKTERDDEQQPVAVALGLEEVQVR